MAVKNAAYHEARITALYTELEALEESPISEYQSDNAGQRQGVKYRTRKEIQEAIKFHERKLARLNSKGFALAIRRTG